MASQVTVRKSLAAMLAVVLVFACAGCGKVSNDTILVPESYYEYFGDNPGDDVETMRKLGSEYVSRVYRKSGGIAIVANKAQRKNLIQKNHYWINYYKDLITDADPKYSVKNSKDFRNVEYCLDYTLDSYTRNEAIEGLSYWYVLTQLFYGAGDKWGLDITIRDSNTHKVVYRVSLPETHVDFNDATWNL